MASALNWPGPPVRSRANQLALASRAYASKVNYLARPRTQTVGQFLPFDPQVDRAPTTGLKAHPPYASGHLKVLILQGGR